MLTHDILRSQYELTRETRSILFDYCSIVSAEHFVAEVPGFGRGGSMRNLLVHNAFTYRHWIGEFALAKIIKYPGYNEYATIKDVIGLYDSIDGLLNEFFKTFEGRFEEEIKDTTPLKVFTHVMTHEFHHKGQILSISRHLGYVPVDTDVVLF